LTKRFIHHQELPSTRLGASSERERQKRFSLQALARPHLNDPFRKGASSFRSNHLRVCSSTSGLLNPRLAGGVRRARSLASDRTSGGQAPCFLVANGGLLLSSRNAPFINGAWSAQLQSDRGGGLVEIDSGALYPSLASCLVFGDAWCVRSCSAYSADRLYESGLSSGLSRRCGTHHGVWIHADRFKPPEVQNQFRKLFAATFCHRARSYREVVLLLKHRVRMAKFVAVTCQALVTDRLSSERSSASQNSFKYILAKDILRKLGRDPSLEP